MDLRRAHGLRAELAGVPVGGWVIGDLIGHGGSAAVFSAKRAGARAAVKVIDPQLLDEFGREPQRRRIEIEAGLVNHGHANLVRLFEAGECTETRHLYVAMEELPYRTLSTVIGAVSADAVGRIIEQIASAAQCLDERGICHRDIKPDNVMVSDDYSHAVLMDLGIVSPFGAAVAGDVDPSGERFIGTARYCPREFVRNQVEKTAEGHRAVTFYQLGGLLHDMIMRQRLFDHIDGPYALLIDAIDHTTPIIDSAEVRPHLIYLARDCLRKLAEERSRLVDWSRFRAAEPNASVDARARVHASRLPAVAVGASAIPRPVFVDRPQLLALGRTLRDRLAALCEANPDLLIPSIDVEVVGKITRLTTEFEPAPARGLHRRFRILFLAEPIGGPEPVFTLDAEVHTLDPPTAGAPSATRVCIVRGLDSDPSIELEDFLYKVIADLMGQPDEPAGGMEA
jgi:tRNA A-37 threonylcarbamoyl transferase component Bud32